MSIKTILLAAATAATLAVPAAAMAQDWGRDRGHEVRYDARRYEDRADRRYGYGYSYSAPVYSYGYDAYRYASPAFRDRDDRRWDHDRYGRYDRRR